MDTAGFTIDTSIDLWLILSVIGIISYYFGRIISDVKPLDQDEKGAYVGGFFFIIGYILLPALMIKTLNLDTNIAGFLFEHLGNGGLIVLIMFLVQFFLQYFFDKKNAALSSKRFSLEDKISNAIEKTANENKVVQVIKANKRQVKMGTDFAEKIYFSPLNQFWAYIFSSIIALCLMVSLSMSENVIFLIIIFLIGVINWSFVAQFLNHPKMYKQVEVSYSGGTLKGKLVRINKNFITLTVDEWVYDVNRDSIYSIKSQGYNKEELNQKLGLM